MWRISGLASMVAVMLLTNEAVGALSFDPWATNIARLQQATFLSADFDNDGRMDLLLHGLTNNILSQERTLVLTNRGNGGFGTFRLLTGTGPYPSFAAGDWNNDGWVDLFRQGAIMVRTNANGGFQDYVSITSLLGHRAWIDFDSDGDLDAMQSGRRDFEVWMQTPKGVFTKRERTYLDAVNVVKGDFNSDGRMDWLALPAGATNRLILYLNTGSSQWGEKELLLPRKVWVETWGHAGVQSVAFDANNDGLTDILLNPLVLLRNTGAGFELAEFGLPVQSWTTVAAGDVNNDGYSDVVVSGSIYLNQCGTNFIKDSFSFSHVEQYPVNGAFLADLNGDGSLDLLAQTDRSFFILTNAAPASPAPAEPQSPSAISGAPQEAELRWSAPPGAAGFSYNVRIGSTPGGVDVVSPHSDVTTGTRRIIEMGNAGQSGRYRISGLMPGTYFWSVQSLDQAHRGSPFTEELPFKHSTVPLIKGLIVTNVTSRSAEITFEINPGGAQAAYWIQYGTAVNNQTNSEPVFLKESTSYNQVSAMLANLDQQSTYFISLMATNWLGTNESRGGFTTEQFVPHWHPTEKTNDHGGHWSFIPGVFAANFNNDDKMDLVTDDYPSLGVNILENVGSAFRPISTLWSNLSGGIRFLDWNNDGALDIAGVETSGTNSWMRLGLGDGRMGFRDADAELPEGLKVFWIPPALNDLDGDGLRDLVVVGEIGGESGLFVFWGTSSGYDSRPLRLTELRRFLIADLDNNGYPDLFANDDWGGRDDLVFANDGNGRFTTIPSNDTGFGPAAVLGVADVDQDGWLDLSFYSAFSKVWLLKNEGTGKYAAKSLAELIRIVNFEWGDYDLDGAPDFLAPSGRSEVVFKNLGKGIFREAPLFELPAGVGHRSHWVDADGDGDLDVAVFQTRTNNFYILENASAPQPVAAPPMNLRSEAPGSGVRLRWSAPDGAVEQSYSYNVRVGTAPGRGDVINPLVAAGSAKLLLHQMGNAELRRFSILTNLPAGDYYWSVQTVDWAYRASEFAPEQKFTIERQLTPLDFRVTLDGHWQMSVTGQRGRRFVTERSEDLEQWNGVATNLLVRWKFTVPIMVDDRKAFFRIRSEL